MRKKLIVLLFFLLLTTSLSVAQESILLDTVTVKAYFRQGRVSGFSGLASFLLSV